MITGYIIIYCSYCYYNHNNPHHYC